MVQIPMIEARKRLTTLPENFAKNVEEGAIAVTRRGKPVLAIMPWDLYEAISETMEILGDPEMMKAVKRSAKEIREGKTISWDDAKKELGL
jgi:prevent-host-death family protein